MAQRQIRQVYLRASAWQPNPGRRSTYRRGKSVQTTGSTSPARACLFHLRAPLWPRLRRSSTARLRRSKGPRGIRTTAHWPISCIVQRNSVSSHRNKMGVRCRSLLEVLIREPPGNKPPREGAMVPVDRDHIRVRSRLDFVLGVLADCAGQVRPPSFFGRNKPGMFFWMRGA